MCYEFNYVCSEQFNEKVQFLISLRSFIQSTFHTEFSVTMGDYME